MIGFVGGVTMAEEIASVVSRIGVNQGNHESLKSIALELRRRLMVSGGTEFSVRHVVLLPLQMD